MVLSRFHPERRRSGGVPVVETPARASQAKNRAGARRSADKHQTPRPAPNQKGASRLRLIPSRLQKLMSQVENQVVPSQRHSECTKNNPAGETRDKSERKSTWRIRLSRTCLGGSVLAFSLLACSGEHLDRTPPATITDLRAAFVEDTSFTLLWTAPGDDDQEGQAATYDLRYALDQAPAVWTDAAVADSLAPPEPAGMAEQHTLGGFSKGQVVYVALRTLDDLENASEFSNTVRVETGDPGPPGTVVDLAASNFLPHGLTLTFTAPGDDSTAGTAARYEVRRSPEPITETTWQSGDPLTVNVFPRPGGSPESLRLVNLEAGSTAHYALRAVDDGGKVGGVSNSVEVSLPEDTVPPGTIQNLRVLTLEPYEATLLWKAPGNDGNESRVAGYEIRYSREYLTVENWDTGTLLPEGPVPMEPGQLQRCLAEGLPRNTELWFGVQAKDEAGNRGGISNVMPGRILPHSGLWEVKQDGTGDAVTVQEAIDKANSGDEVLVWPGTYLENLIIRRKSLTLKSRSGPEVTILDGSVGDGPVIRADSSETVVTVEGFTITGGSGVRYNNNRLGGGIYGHWGVTLIIRGNVIRENTTISNPPSFNSRGAAIWFAENRSRVIIEKNILEDNYSSGNGGCINIEGPVLIQDNIIRRNRTGTGDGAGVRYASNTQPVVIRRNLFLENKAGDHGGGIYISNSHVPSSWIEIYENVFIGNVACGGGVAADCSGGAIWMSYRGAHVHHNTIAFNKADKSNNFFASVGGICERNPWSEVRVEYNLLYHNKEGAIGVYGVSNTPAKWVVTFRRNLLYEDGPQDIYQGVFDAGVIELILEENIYADPMFCILGPESRGELAGASPALYQPFGVIGAIKEPSCPPYYHEPAIERGSTPP